MPQVEKISGGCFSQQQAKEMYQLLSEIYSSLRDKNRNKHFKQIPFIELAWMQGIEKQLSKFSENIE